MTHAGWNGPETKGAERTNSLGTRDPSVTGNGTDTTTGPILFLLLIKVNSIPNS